MFNIKNIFLILVLSSATSEAVFSWQSMKSVFVGAKKEKKMPVAKVAVININKSIEDVFGSASVYIRAINKNQSIKGIVLCIDSNGGNTGCAATLTLELMRLKKKMPIVAFINSNACSGGYLIAAIADFIIASPGAAVGSIGVIHSWEEHDKVRIDRNGYKADVKHYGVIKGKYKHALNTQVITEEHKQIFVRMVESQYDWFTSQVASSRGLKLEERDIWADGKVFSAIDGCEIGLVDVLGSWSDIDDCLKQSWKKRGMGEFGEIKYINKNGIIV